MYAKLKHISTRLVEQILPPTSPIDHKLVSSNGALTAEHWQKLHFLTGSLCSCCGRPMPQILLAEILCAKCEIKRPRITKTRSALVYNDASRALILNFKYGGHTDNLHSFASWMHFAAQDILRPPGILVPVPLHMYRRMQRKFNQSALLANTLSKLSGLAHKPLWLKRHRNTPIQGFLSPARRVRNVSGAFSVPSRFLPDLRDKHIILVDDVRTSGATLEACARELLAAGAKEVNAITLTRVVKLEEPVT